jgi:CRP-like cAMP-binding protein
MKEITFNKDQIIFCQGENASVMYDIISGKIGIYTDYQTEQEKKIAELDAGEVFGEMGLIEYWPRSATAVALEDGTVVTELGEDDLKEYLKDKPEKLLVVMRQLSRRIRETTQNYVNVCRTVNENRRTQEELDKYAALYTQYWLN